MRKLFALAAMAVFALTLSLGTIGCAPKAAEETPAPAESSMETPPAETPMADSTMADTTSHM